MLRSDESHKLPAEKLKCLGCSDQSRRSTPATATEFNKDQAMASITDMHVKILGIEELDTLLDLIESNLAVLPIVIVKAYSELVRERAKLELVK